MTTTAEAPPDEQSYRLPRSVLPRRYSLVMEPDLDAATFAGTEVVDVEVVETVEQIVLNAVELAVDRVELVAADGRRLTAEVTHDEAAERVTLRPEAPLEPGRWTVELGFRGTLNDKLHGFYRSVYNDEAGVSRTIATTQFESTDARRAFPCWDEPDMKAVFSTTIVVQPDLLAISNAAEVGRTTRDDGRVEVRFADTIPMSTYLVAFIVGPLEVTEPVDVDGVPLRVVHVPGKGHLAPFSLEVGAFCLRFFADYYGIAYPGDKVDLIALPDFAAGAMENLGAITFREAVLLIDPAAATQAELQRVADVVAHELAHMWFGDLVTMGWWNGIWLNEAFATFMELLAVDAYKPEWERWVAFTIERSAAFSVDSLASTRPIEYPVRSPHEAEGMFDLLTYQKGASVLRMLEQYLGAGRFQAGIRRYLDERKFANAETTDLWDAIEAATGEPVRAIMDTWIYQGGYPLISVAAANATTALEQRRFTFAGADEAAPATWSVPILLGAPGSPPTSLLLDGPATTVATNGEGVVVNAGGHGFYRVRYEPELLGWLRSELGQLLPVERALLVDDTWASVLAGSTPAAALLELAEAFPAESDRTVWSTLLLALGGLDRILDGEARDRFRSRVRRLLRPSLDRMTWEPADEEGELDRQLRGTIIGALGTLAGDREVQDRARAVHAAALADPSSVDPNVVAAVVAVVASVGSDEEYEVFLDRYRTSDSPQESLRYLYAIASFPSPRLAERTLEMTLTDDVRSQNAPFVLLTALMNRDNGGLAWRFLKGRWAALDARLASNAMPRLLGGITTLSTPELAADVQAFLAVHPVPQGTRIVEQHLERLRVNVALRAREAGPLAEALAAAPPSPPS